MITRIDVMPARPTYRTGKALERYAEERLWQRALSRLEGPRQQSAKAPPKKQTEERRVSSFAAVLRAVQSKLGRHVDLLV